MENISTLRREYTKMTLDESSVFSDPKEQFEKWFGEAQKSEVLEPNAMILCTVDADYTPHSRIVLLKGMTEEGGLIFFTNYQSDKAKQMEQNQNVGISFVWLELERQVHIKGTVTKASKEVSEQYFKSRPIKSQLGALASEQSKIISNRNVLEDAYAKFEKMYPNDVPMPEHWGGYIIEAVQYEFWQGRASRLHDRIKYTLEGGDWVIQRLAP